MTATPACIRCAAPSTVDVWVTPGGLGLGRVALCNRHRDMLARILEDWGAKRPEPEPQEGLRFSAHTIVTTYTTVDGDILWAGEASAS